MKISPLLISLLALSIQADSYKISIDKKHYLNSISIKEVQEESNNSEDSNSNTYSSCLEILNNNASTGNGVYTINNGSDYSVYCDMTTEGGGWTLIVAQYENGNVTNWNQGIQGNYDPSLSSQTSFVLNSQEIPSHTQTGFGISLSEIEGYIDFQYTTGNIGLTDVNYTYIANQTTEVYQIHRDTSSFYGWHDPENSYFYNLTDNFYQHPTIPDYNSYDWVNTLTINKKNSTVYSEPTNFAWAFSPNHQDAQSRGFAHHNTIIHLQTDSNPWLIWVR